MQLINCLESCINEFKKCELAYFLVVAFCIKLEKSELDVLPAQMDLRDLRRVNVV